MISSWSCSCSLKRKIFDAFSFSTPTMPLNIALVEVRVVDRDGLEAAGGAPWRARCRAGGRLKDCGEPSRQMTIAPCWSFSASVLRTISVSRATRRTKPLGDGAELAVLHRAHAEGAHHHQVVVGGLAVLD